ncbi:exosortase system-associated protein, TIGR04073 family [Omnitrophica bacterium]|nr:exosortase system-associated protein, TIGR04073 family [Candidatus Omnitrophota bacterium]
MKKVALLLALCLIVCAPVFAGTIQENAASDDYVLKAPAMLLRGVGEIILSPLEIITNVYQKTLDEKPVYGTIYGAVEGTLYALDRAGRGVWDVVTCLAPGYNGEPTDREVAFLG